MSFRDQNTDTPYYLCFVWTVERGAWIDTTWYTIRLVFCLTTEYRRLNDTFEEDSVKQGSLGEHYRRRERGMICDAAFAL